MRSHGIRTRSRGIALACIAFVLGPLMQVFTAPVSHAAELLSDDGAVSMVASSRAVYWTMRTGCPGFELDQAVCRIRGRRATNFLPWYVFSNVAGPRTNDIASNLAVDDQYFYWISRGGQIMRLPLNSGFTRPPTPIATKIDAGSQSEIAVDDTWIYWSENDEATGSGSIYRRTKATSEELLVPITLMHRNSSPIRRLSPDGTGGALFVTSTFAGIGLIDHLARVRSDRRVESSGSVLVDSLTVHDGRVYWVTHGPATTRGARDPEIRSAPVGALTESRVLTTILRSTDLRIHALLVADDNRLHWQETRGMSGPLQRMPIAGGAVETLPGTLPPVVGLAATDLLIAAQASTGQIFVIEYGSASETMDLVADEIPLEVVQVIQDMPAHDVALISGKRTFARMYGRIGSTTGRREVQPWPGAWLEGSRVVTTSTGTSLERLPGSPLLPVDARRLLRTDPVVRSGLEGMYLFELPESWTHGTVRLKGTLNPRGAVRETTRVNNSAGREVTFQPAKGICLDMLPVLTHAGVSLWASRDRSESHRSHFERAKSVLPTAHIEPIQRGGPVRMGPYHMHSGVMKFQLLMNLNVEFAFSDPPCPGDRWRSVRTVAAQDSNRYGMQLHDAMYFWARWTGIPANMPDGGIKGLAHELGHELFRAHVHCSDEGWPYESFFLLDPCTIDDVPNRIIGFDAMSPSGDPRLILPSDGYADVMTYGYPIWVSAQIYERLRSNLGSPPATSGTSGSSGARVASAGAPATSSSGPVTTPGGPTKLLFTGMVPEKDKPAIGFAYEIGGSALARTAQSIAAQTKQSKEFALRLYDAQNALVSTHPLNLSFATTEDPTRVDGFFNIVDVQPSVVRAEIAGPGASVSRVAGPTPPTAQITSPSAGATVGDDLKIRWKPLDADGDEVRSLVRYSPDDGQTWIALGADLAGGALDVPMRDMPGGPAARVQVIVSDGLNSTTTTSAAFSVPSKAPYASILDEGFEALDMERTATADAGASVRFFSTGGDAEDGPLVGGARRWKVTGPQSFEHVGEDLVVRDVQPGTYSVALSVVDRDKNLGFAKTVLKVGPKRITSGEAPTLDGSCTDDAYAGDPDPIRFHYADSLVAEARLARAKGTLFACFAGLPDRADTDEVVVRFDTAHDGGQIRDADDLVFLVKKDGRIFSGASGAGKDEFDEVPRNAFDAAVFGNELGWSVELAFDAAAFAVEGASVGVRAAHRWTGKTESDGGEVAWPTGSLDEVPGSWGTAVFGAGPGRDPKPNPGALDDFTELTLFGPASVDSGAKETYEGSFSVHHAFGFTEPLGFQQVELLLDGQPAGSARTSPGGAYEISVAFAKTGTYSLVAVANRGTALERRSRAISVSVRK